MRTLIGSGIQAKTKLAYDHYRPRALRLTLHIPVLPSALGAGLRSAKAVQAHTKAPYPCSARCS